MNADAGAAEDDYALTEAEANAAEYALGVLEAEALRAAEARARADAAFAAEALAWSERLSPLLDQVPPVPPSADAWPVIAARLGDEPDGDSRPVDMADWRRVEAEAARLRRGRAGWRAAALAASAALAACAAALGGLLLRPAPLPPPMMVAVLTPTGAGAGATLTATYDPLRKAVLIDSPAASRGRTPELWLIGASGAPRALGLITGPEVALVALSGETVAEIKAADVLAVSLEPEGGSPTGQPTGPVVAKGVLRPAGKTI